MWNYSPISQLRNLVTWETDYAPRFLDCRKRNHKIFISNVKISTTISQILFGSYSRETVYKFLFYIACQNNAVVIEKNIFAFQRGKVYGTKLI